MNKLEIINRGIEVQETIGFGMFQNTDPLYHDSLYSFAKIIYNYLAMAKIGESTCDSTKRKK
jgi:hypothetical protein